MEWLWTLKFLDFERRKLLTIWGVTRPSFVIWDRIIHHIELAWLLRLDIACSYIFLLGSEEKLLRLVDFLMEGFEKGFICRGSIFEICYDTEELGWDFHQILAEYLPFWLRFYKVYSCPFLTLLENLEIILQGLVFHGEFLDYIHQLAFISLQILDIIHVLLRIIPILHLP